MRYIIECNRHRLNDLVYFSSSNIYVNRFHNNDLTDSKHYAILIYYLSRMDHPMFAPEQIVYVRYSHISPPYNQIEYYDVQSD